MITVRQSHLEAFRRVIQTDYGNEGELVRAIQGNPDPPNWMMEAGTKWHEALATGANCPVGYRFDGEAIEAARRYLGPGLFEIPGSRIFDLGRESIRVTGTADHLRGLILQDSKTKFSTPDARDYEHSLQWRLYLLIHECVVFRYHLWDFSLPKEGYCELHGVVSFNFWAYQGMESDCKRWISHFVQWAYDRDLITHLERRAA